MATNEEKLQMIDQMREEISELKSRLSAKHKRSKKRRFVFWIFTIAFLAGAAALTYFVILDKPDLFT